MKKMGMLILATTVMFCNLSFASETSIEAETEAETELDGVIDLSIFTDDEIIALSKQITQELIERKVEKSAELTIGTYVCGKDFPVGSYIITPHADQVCTCQITDREGKFLFFANLDGNEGESASFAYDEGDNLYVDCQCDFTISAGLKFG